MLADRTATYPPPAATIGSRVRWAEVAVVTMAVCSIVAGAIHAYVTPEHVMEAQDHNVPAWLPLAFAAGAGGGLVYGYGLLATAATRAWLTGGILLTLPMVVLGFWSRTVGLPGAEVEPATPAWTVATLAELAVLVLAVLVLTAGRAGIRPSRGLAVGGAAVALALAAAAFLLVPDAWTHTQMLAAWTPTLG